MLALKKLRDLLRPYHNNVLVPQPLVELDECAKRGRLGGGVRIYIVIER